MVRSFASTARSPACSVCSVPLSRISQAGSGTKSFHDRPDSILSRTAVAEGFSRSASRAW